MRSQSNSASNRHPFAQSSGFRKYWPLVVMTLLFAGCWVPYFLGGSAAATTIQQQPPVALTGWGVETPTGAPVPNAAFAVIGTTQFAAKYQDRYEVLVVTRVQDDTIDSNADRVIDKSNPFQIAPAKIDVNFGPLAIARFNQPRMVMIIVAVVPKQIDLSEITTIGSLATHGGFILAAGAAGVPGVVQR